MTPDELPLDATQERNAQRVEHSLEQLNTRIALLARLVGADLSSEAVVESILSRSHPFFLGHERSGGLDQSNDQRRLIREWEELRGLLTLRCDLMAHTLSDLGLKATQEIASHVQTRRDKEGLKADSDGFHLRHRLEPPTEG